MQNKKGILEIGEGVTWIARFILITLVGLAIVIVVDIYYGSSIDTRAIESTLLLERLDSCFPSPIDISTFTDDSIGSCFDFRDQGALTTILEYEKNSETQKKDISTSREIASYLKVQCSLTGKNVPLCKKSRKYVLVKVEDKVYPAKLEAEIFLKR